MKYLILAVLVGVAAAQVAHNVQGYSSAQVILMALNDTDTNRDGKIDEAEFNNELMKKWDQNGDGIITKTEFVQMWSVTYHDNIQTTEKFFDNLDRAFPRGILNEIDMFFHLPSLDPDHDLVITFDDLANFLHQMHPYGVPK